MNAPTPEPEPVYPRLITAQKNPPEIRPDPTDAGTGAAVPAVDVVVVGILVREGRVLLCHRHPRRRWFPDVWDFPGGHVEPGETATGALVRELWEELGVRVDEPAGTAIHQVRTATLDLSLWPVRAWSGEIRNRAPDEHDAIGWFEPGELAGLDLADVRYPEWIGAVLGSERS